MSAVLCARPVGTHNRSCVSCDTSISELPAGALRCLACEWLAMVAAAHRALDPWSLVPNNVRARLAEEGAFTLGDWRALGPRRFEIFGVTSGMARQLDHLASVA